MSAGDWLMLPLVLAGSYVAIGLTFRKTVRDSMADFLSDDGDAIRAHVRSIGGLNRVTWLTGSTWPSLIFFLVKSIREQRRDAKRGKP